MEKIEYKNAEGYADPTAYQAIKNAMSIRRGQIWYIDNEREATGSEMGGTRPGIIVSNDANNKFSRTVEVVFLTTAHKKDIPTHVTIRSSGRISTALAEQVTTVDVSRVRDLCGTLTRQELQALDAAILISLGLSAPKTETTPEPKPEPKTDPSQLIRLETERDLYRQLYTELLAKVTKEN